MFKSLRGRLTLSYIAVVILSLLLGLLTLLLVIRPILVKLTYSSLVDKAIPTARLVGELAQGSATISTLKSELEEQAAGQQVRIILAEARGNILVDTGGQLAGLRTTELDLNPTEPQSRYIYGRFTTPSGEELLYIGIPVPSLQAITSIQRQVILVLAVPVRGMWGVLREMFSGLLWAGMVTILVAAVLALLITRSLSSPLKKIAAAAQDMARGNYDLQLEIDYPSEMREVATSFNQMAHEVKQSRQTLRDFVANVSHELKTPLTSIRGYADAIVDGAAGGEQEQQHAARVIRDESMRMTRLVEQLLDLSRIESGQVVMARQPVQVDQVLQSCVDKMSLAAGDKGVTLTCDCPSLPSMIGDGDRLAQVFTNLLDNAIKHTPEGGKARVTARLSPGTETGNRTRHVEIAFTDTGPGIPTGDLERIFERFYQVDKSRARGTGGAGLGLAICKSIVDAHGGSIWAESLEDLGTRFTVRLPLTSDTV